MIRILTISIQTNLNPHTYLDTWPILALNRPHRSRFASPLQLSFEPILLVALLLAQPNYGDNTCPLVSAIIIPKSFFCFHRLAFSTSKIRTRVPLPFPQDVTTLHLTPWKLSQCRFKFHSCLYKPAPGKFLFHSSSAISNRTSTPFFLSQWLPHPLLPPLSPLNPRRPGR
jgi:hypothetical protein